jgi:hypothetical protein
MRQAAATGVGSLNTRSNVPEGADSPLISPIGGVMALSVGCGLGACLRGVEAVATVDGLRLDVMSEAMAQWTNPCYIM